MESIRLFAWNNTLGRFQRLTVDPATGNLNVTGGGGGGGSGPVTVADGADVAQGATTDASSANTIVGILKAIKAAVQGTLTVATHAVTQSGAWSVTADTELPAAAVLADADPNPTTSRVAANGMLWNGATWDRAPGNAASGLKVQSAQLPAALAAGGGMKVEGVAGGVAQPVSLATNTPDVTDRAARLLGRARLTDDTNLSTIKAASTLAAATDTALVVTQRDAVDVSDRAARLLGVVDKGKVWDGTNIAAVKAASALAAAADPALVVQQSPQDPQASVLAVTTTAATGVAATLTIPAAAAGLFHYITYLEISLYATAARTGGATPILVTTTNLPGSPVWDFDTAQAIGAMIRQQLAFAKPLKSSAAATATTIVAPIATTGIWRITAFYYTAP
jgi:hypothetical protein